MMVDMAHCMQRTPDPDERYLMVLQVLKEQGSIR